MTCNTARTKVITTPSIDHAINSFFNTAIGDVLKTHPSKRHVSKPATNVIKEDDKFILEVALPGFAKPDIAINIEDEVLTVSDQRSETSAEKKYRLREFNYTGFSKSFHLPDDIDIEKVSASFEHGILVIELGKKDEALPQAPKSIEIK